MDEIRFQVFVSSTFEDLKEERQKVWEALVSLGFIVSGMEAFPATNEAQFQFIKRQIEQTDYFVLILGGRYGTSPDDVESFTEKEFNYAHSLGVPIFVFLHHDINSLPVLKTDRDQQKTERLEAFRDKASRDRLCAFWKTADDLALGIIKALHFSMARTPRPGWKRGGTTASAEILEELRSLKNENDKLKLAASLTLSDELSPEIAKELRKGRTFSYFNVISTKTSSTLSLSPANILEEMSLFERPAFEVFEECLRGAVAARSSLEFEDIAVERAEVDRAILLLAKVNVVEIDRPLPELSIRQGSNWLAAHSYIKLNR